MNDLSSLLPAECRGFSRQTRVRDDVVRPPILDPDARLAEAIRRLALAFPARAAVEIRWK